jgi:hypothetical protein
VIEENWSVLHLLPLVVVHSLTLGQIIVSRVFSRVFDGPLSLCLAIFLHVDLFPILDFHCLIFECDIASHLNWGHRSIFNLLLASLGAHIGGIGIAFVLVILES